MRIASILAIFALAACGYKTPEYRMPSFTPNTTGIVVLERARERDRAVAKADRIVYSADTLLLSSLDVHSGDLDLYTHFSCSGTRCVDPDGAVFTLQDMLAEAERLGSLDLEEIEFETRNGFHTVRYSGGMDLGELLEGLRVSGQSVESFDFWGNHGLASVATAEVALSGSLGGVPLDDLAVLMNMGVVVGDAAGSNPATSATWRGIAEAYDAAGRTGSGTATLTVDLSGRPTVDAEIRIGLSRVGPPGWSGIPLSGGRFETGSGFDDHIVGNFHGPDHEEAWGAFDTSDWSGVFGAKK